VPRVGIAIVNYRTAGLVVDCLRSLDAEMRARGDCHVIVVDNNSGDGSAERIADAVRAEGFDWATVLPLDRNPGFAGGNNAALRPLLAETPPPDYLMLLNPDTIVRPGAVTALVDFLEAHPRAGFAGSRLEDPDGTPQRSAFRFHSVASEFENGMRLGLVSKVLRGSIVAPPVRLETYRTDWVCGASVMIRRRVFDDVGLMDERYFLYYEEVDFILKARRAGWECWYVPASRVVHLEGQATGVTGAKKALRPRPRYWFESRARYFRQNHGPLYKALADVAWACGYAVYRMRRRLQRKPETDPPGLLRDFVRFNFLGLS